MSEKKRAAGIAAASLVRDGQRLGLGTGSTVFYYLEALGRRIKEEGLRVSGVPTSADTARKAGEFGIPILTPEEAEDLDLYVDGADEIDPEFRMIKGGGGALLREKLVATASRRRVIVVDAAKLVNRLGTTFALPVEVSPYGIAWCLRWIARLGCEPVLRMRDGEKFVTDNGNLILDCRFPEGLADPEGMEKKLREIPGVVCTGLFIGLAHEMIVGQEGDKVEHRIRPAGG